MQRILEHSFIYALIEIGEAPSTAPGLSSENVQSKRAALVALDQMDGGTLTVEHVAPLLSSNDLVLKRTAAWIIGHRPEWGGALATHFRERLANVPASPEERDELTLQLARLAKSPQMQELFTASLQKNGDAAVVALSAIGRAGLKETPGPWLDAVAVLLQQANAVELPQLVAAATKLPLPKGGHAAFTTALMDIGRNAGTAAEPRLQALAAAGRLNSLEPALFEFLTAQIIPSAQPALRTLASGILAKAELSAAQQLALAGAIKQVGPLDLPQLMQAFSRGGDEAAGLKLVASLESAAGLRSLRPDALKAVFAKYPKNVQDAGAALIESLAADTAKQAARLEELLAKVKGGNAERGKIVFSTKGTCITCHTKGGIGANFGPDLSTVHQVRSERDLLESIIFPSASFVRSFEPFTVVTTSNEAITGIVRKDAPDEVVIAINAQTEKRIARSDIKKMRADNLSVMPQGFDQLLTPEELADLIAFLKSK